ncbi:hypothetical protein G6F50_017625 [Rhizopus delemar]|uniref:Uncharacterized protein n=1 Tax=Rhizopus delemar TaxID=936053 RepID=A0A9P7C0I8_9FUNG|nr:hypothetical protein G6F50_017625 [Rhizopus delemar]
MLNTMIPAMAPKGLPMPPRITAANMGISSSQPSSGITTALMPSSTPPAMAPTMLPMPPNTAAVKAFRPSMKPIVYWDTP